MSEIGKHAPGLKGFPTPNTAAGTIAYLLLYFPDQEWAQYALGALRVLEAGYNWYEAGDVSPDDAAAAFRVIDEQAPLNKLPVCSLPTGEPLMRIDPATGHIQDVDSDGNWQDDPDIPPTPARPPAPPDDERCLAAANCANALQILYESLSDSFNAGLTDAEAAAALVVAVGEVLGTVFAFPIAALIAVAFILFQVMYAVVQFITADLWTEDFTAVLQCYLYECSSVADDVVTFNFNCVIGKLAAQTSAESLTGEQLRLFGQLYYLLSWIGVDGLNAAGAATAITSATCDCAEPWCYQWTSAAALLLDGWTHEVDTGASQFWDASFDVTLTKASMTWTTDGTGTGGDSAAAIWNGAGFTDRVALIAPLAGGANPLEWTGSSAIHGMSFGLNAASGSGGIVTVALWHLEGTGDRPSWIHGEDCS